MLTAGRRTNYDQASSNCVDGRSCSCISYDRMTETPVATLPRTCKSNLAFTSRIWYCNLKIGCLVSFCREEHRIKCGEMLVLRRWFAATVLPNIRGASRRSIKFLARMCCNFRISGFGDSIVVCNKTNRVKMGREAFTRVQGSPEEYTKGRGG